MGSSGAGKSTLLNIISTIDLPSSGDIYINGKNTIKMKQNELADFRRDNLGFVFQDSNLLDTLTIKENIMLPLSLKNERVSVIENRINEISRELNIESILDKYPSEVSGGQKQRGAVCRAIATKPSLVLADEPTGALDSKSARDLLNCLLKLNKDSNKTILMVTHDAISASFCNRILFIKDGIIFTEIVKGESNREFYNKIVNTVSLIGGVNKNDFI
ncbi:ABC transporter ATP-binding protein [Clostridioides difficile]|nr:ABC transporter ATP-binding protein [Clostridioides difficile]GMK65747.1 ABC transporter ATP-binding protein [Clostridioides difficile]